MSVFCIGNIDIRDFEKYRESGYLENAARTITVYGCLLYTSDAADEE